MKEVIAEDRKSRKTCMAMHRSPANANLNCAEHAPLLGDEKTASLHTNAATKVASSTGKVSSLKLPLLKKGKARLTIQASRN